MKAYLDASMINWLRDDPRAGDLFALTRDNKLEAVVGGDVVAEIAATPLTKRDRCLRLLGIVFGGVLRLAPSSIPLLGSRPRSASDPIRRRSRVWSVPTPPRATALFRIFNHLGITKLDAIHLIEADLAGADAFLTTDDDFLKRRAPLRTHTRVEILSPWEVLSRLGPKGKNTRGVGSNAW